MDLFNQLSSWADDVIIGGRQYYFISRHKVIEELPWFFNKTDTVYRVFKRLDKKKLIVYKKEGDRDLIRLTKTGTDWNRCSRENTSGFSEDQSSDHDPKELGFRSDSQPKSDFDPSKSGFRSEFNNDSQNSPSTPENTRVSGDRKKPDSDFDPTYNNITIQKITHNAHTRAGEGELNAFNFLKENNPQQLEAWLIKEKRQIEDFELFVLNFNSVVEIAELPYKSKVLFARLTQYAANWKANRLKQRKNSNRGNQKQDPIPPYLKKRIG